MTRDDWLQKLKAGDKVIVCIGKHNRQERTVDSACATLITIGRHRKTNYRRADGMIAGTRPFKHLFRLEMP